MTNHLYKNICLVYWASLSCSSYNKSSVGIRYILQGLQDMLLCWEAFLKQGLSALCLFVWKIRHHHQSLTDGTRKVSKISMSTVAFAAFRANLPVSTLSIRLEIWEIYFFYQAGSFTCSIGLAWHQTTFWLHLHVLHADSHLGLSACKSHFILIISFSSVFWKEACFEIYLDGFFKNYYLIFRTFQFGKI